MGRNLFWGIFLIFLCTCVFMRYIFTYASYWNELRKDWRDILWQYLISVWKKCFKYEITPLYFVKSSILTQHNYPEIKQNKQYSLCKTVYPYQYCIHSICFIYFVHYIFMLYNMHFWIFCYKFAKVKSLKVSSIKFVRRPSHTML